MGMRRDARERAIQFLFQHDLNPPVNLDEALTVFWEAQRASVLGLDDELRWQKESPRVRVLPEANAEEAELRSFADPLIRGALEHREECDATIQRIAKNWDIKRMAVVDRNVLRLAVYEMLHRADIPPVVSINEAVDIAKKFSTGDSGKFVNGILDKIRGELMRPARDVN